MAGKKRKCVLSLRTILTEISIAKLSLTGYFCEMCHVDIILENIIFAVA